jgi:hypothetical protein
MQMILKILLSPFVFGVGFVAPLIAQSLSALGVLPWGIESILIGLGAGAALGLIAQLRGSWVWIKP